MFSKDKLVQMVHSVYKSTDYTNALCSTGYGVMKSVKVFKYKDDLALVMFNDEITKQWVDVSNLSFFVEGED